MNLVLSQSINIHKKILAFGHEAKQMVGKTPETIEIIRPLKGGVIADFDTTTDMVRICI